jgi:UDP-glucose 4-epimerase
MALSGIALVTGGAGFIGSHIAAALASRGARVRVIDDLSTGHPENLDEIGGDVDFVRGSLNDAGSLRRALEGVELVFHEAAIPSVPRSVENPRETHDACVNATFSLLLAAKESGVRRVVYAASSSAYGDQPTLPKVETMSPDPLSPYAAAKLVGEYYCQVFTNLLAAESARAVGHVINVANGRQTSLNELLSILKGITGRGELETDYREPRAGDVRHSLADITRARDLLGYEPRVGMEEGLQKTIDWWKQSRFST